MSAGAVSLKNLTKREEVRKGADQAKYLSNFLLISFGRLSLTYTAVLFFHG